MSSLARLMNLRKNFLEHKKRQLQR